MVDKTPAEITPGSASRGSVVHASDAGLGDLSRSHTEEGISRLQSAINVYSATNTYNIGDIVKEGNLFVRNITAVVTPEVFDPAKWELISNEFGIFMNSYDTDIAADTDFFTVQGDAAGNPQEVDAQAPVPQAIVTFNYTLTVNTNTLINPMDWVFRINGADGNGIITIGGGITGTFQDTVNNDVLSLFDLIDYQYREGAGGGAATLVGSSSTFLRAP